MKKPPIVILTAAKNLGSVAQILRCAQNDTFSQSSVLSPQHFHRRRGFTLIELIVVMSIIVLIAAVSVPAFKFITGSRSVDSGANVVNAMMGRARIAALTTQTNYGVFFFVDPRNDRTTLALVHQNNADAEYTGWSPVVNSGQLVDGQGAVASVNSATWYFDAGTNPDIDPSSSLQNVVTGNEKIVGSNFSRCAPLVFQCILTHQEQSPTKQVSSVPAYFNTWWNSNANGLDIARDTELQLLPAGVGAEVVVDPQVAARLSGVPGTQRLGINRYLRTGCVMFDSQGRFATLPFDVYNSSHLGQALMLDNVPSHVTSNPSLSVGQDPNNPLPLYSGFGVVLYDRAAFLADAKINNYSEGDYLYGDASSQTSWHLPPPPYGLEIAPQQPNLQPSDVSATPAKPEFAKEQWLDANGTLFTATRYNGAMTKSE